LDALKLGPLVFPIQVVLALAGVLLAVTLAGRKRAADGRDASDVLWKMILAGFVVGRLVFVVRHWDVYAGAPFAMLDLRDGGLDVFAGLVSAGLLGFEQSRRSRPLRGAVFSAALAGCAVFFGGGALNTAFTPAGAAVPALALHHLAGAPAQLRDFHGKPLVVNLWATWCPPCRRELPALAAAQRAHPEVDIVFVNQGEAGSAVSAYLAGRQLVLANVLLDPASQLAARAGAAGFPTTLFYDANGRLVERHMGELSAATLDEQLAALRTKKP